MRIDVDRNEFDCILDALEGNILKCQRKTAEQLRARLKFQLRGGPPSDKSWAPIRSPRLDAHVKPDRKRNWSYKPQRKASKNGNRAQPKPQLSADQILANL